MSFVYSGDQRISVPSRARLRQVPAVVMAVQLAVLWLGIQPLPVATQASDPVEVTAEQHPRAEAGHRLAAVVEGREPVTDCRSGAV